MPNMSVQDGKDAANALYQGTGVVPKPGTYCTMKLYSYETAGPGTCNNESMVLLENDTRGEPGQTWKPQAHNAAKREIVRVLALDPSEFSDVYDPNVTTNRAIVIRRTTASGNVFGVVAYFNSVPDNTREELIDRLDEIVGNGSSFGRITETEFQQIIAAQCE